MKSILLLLYLFLFVQAEKFKVGVQEFTSKSLTPSQCDVITDNFSQAILKTGIIDIVERRDLGKIMQEQALSQSGVTEENQSTGKILNVDYMLLGSIENTNNIFTFSLRLVNVESGFVLKQTSEQFQGNLKDFLKKGVNDAIKSFSSELTPVSVDFSFLGIRKKTSFEIHPSDTLRTEDKMHITIIPKCDCYVYLINKDEGGNIYVLFPNITQCSNLLQSNQEYHIPDHNSAFELDSVCGNEEVYVIASRTPVTDLQQMISDQKSVDNSTFKTVTTRGFAHVVKGDNVKVNLQGLSPIQAASQNLSGLLSFKHKVLFYHIKKL